MKKTLSIILSVVMLLSITAGIDLSAYATTYYEKEDNDSYTSANILSHNSSICGSIRGDYDEYDYYKFTLSSNSVVDVQISHTKVNTDGFWSLHIYKYAGSNNLEDVYCDYVYAYDEKVSLPNLGLSSGTYYIEISTWYESIYDVQYTVTLGVEETDSWEAEFNDEYYLADEIKIGSTKYGNICGDYDNYDYYKFTLSNTTNVNLSLAHNKVSNNGYWAICIYKYLGSNDLDLIFSDYVYVSDNNYKTPNLTLSSGTYYVEMGTWYESIYGVNYGITINYALSTPSSLKVSTRNTTSLKLSWSKVSGASGYQLQGKYGDSYYTEATTSSTSATVYDLCSATAYKFRVRAYKTVDGKKYYSSWKYLTTATKPGKVSIKSPSTNTKHQIIAKWYTVARASGYQVQYCRNSSCSNVVATKTISGQSKSSYTGKNFNKGRKYYVRVRAYKTVNGTKYYGAWSSVKSIKCK